MAFFGLTCLGYQNPIGERMKANFRGPACPDAGNSNVQPGTSPSLQQQPGPLIFIEDCQVSHQPLPYSTDIHHGSHEQYKDMVRHFRTPRSPNELYVIPLTENQQYGWMVSKKPEPWTQIRQFPRKNSEMTKIFQAILKVDQYFSMI